MRLTAPEEVRPLVAGDAEALHRIQSDPEHMRFYPHPFTMEESIAWIQRAIEHYAKHGREFGNVTQDQYLQMAQQLRDSRPGKNVLEAKRPSGGRCLATSRASAPAACSGAPGSARLLPRRL